MILGSCHVLYPENRYQPLPQKCKRTPSNQKKTSSFQSTSCKHPVIVLQDVSFLDLHALVEFIYHGEVNVHQNSLSSFLKTAEILRVSGLTQQQAAETNSVSRTKRSKMYMAQLFDHYPLINSN